MPLQRFFHPTSSSKSYFTDSAISPNVWKIPSVASLLLFLDLTNAAMAAVISSSIFARELSSFFYFFGYWFLLFKINVFWSEKTLIYGYVHFIILISGCPNFMLLFYLNFPLDFLYFWRILKIFTWEHVDISYELLIP